MAHSISSKKRIRQNIKRNLRNKAVKSRLRTFAKKLRSALEESRVEEARKLLAQSYKLYDQAAAKGVIHPNHAARKKSRMCAMVNAAKGGD